ncbi:MAG: peptide chain release factor 1 [Gammaproteobacteria bacterium]|nr:peptide chain release factor 1 [Gammaproteobacteria bacterium]
MALSENLQSKLEQICDRHEELGRLLTEAEVVADRVRFPQLSREYSELEQVVAAFTLYRSYVDDLTQAQDLANEDDEEMRALALETVAELTPLLESQVETLQRSLLPKDPNDDANVYLEIRAGTGGEEAGLFSADLFNMYLGYANARGWQNELVSANTTGIGGFKQVVVRLAGRDVYSKLKFEAGAHRVQRVPKTESQGRIHTSACTVAVMPDKDEDIDIEIDKSELRIDRYRASGAGGQHVNKTDSAVRITHLPTGTVAECQQERSQIRNRERAMSLLLAKLRDAELTQRRNQEASDRKAQVGSGDRSERIRTYNFPQGRITDHRINLTLYKLDEVLAGELDQIIEPLTLNHQAEQLQELHATNGEVPTS